MKQHYISMLCTMAWTLLSINASGIGFTFPSSVTKPSSVLSFLSGNFVWWANHHYFLEIWFGGSNYAPAIRNEVTSQIVPNQMTKCQYILSIINHSNKSYQNNLPKKKRKKKKNRSLASDASIYTSWSQISWLQTFPSLFPSYKEEIDISVDIFFHV